MSVPLAQAPPARRFRPDIEGLRAVAVLLVVLYHAHLGGVSGGYVGVDVFFVISGFLITRQLFESQERSGRVQLSDFYIRRMKRLLPAALVVTAAVLAAARIWSSTLAAKDVARDAVYTALYGMNVHLAAEGTDYLNATKAPSPLQHFWSLAVEEQFYVGLPLLILAVAFVQARYQRAALLGVVGTGVCVSLYLCLVTTHSAAPVAYFSIGTRAWELGAGSLLALLAPRLTRLPAVVAAVGSWAGLGMILYSGFSFDESTAFPGSAALIPIAGTVLVVATGCRKEPFGAEMLLGRWIAQLLGQISYSWYLWHWPVLVFAPLALGHELSIVERVEAVFVSMLLAVATYFHVELPGRRLKMRRPAWVLTGPALAGLTAALAILFSASLPALTGSGGAVANAALNTSDLRVVQQELVKSLSAVAAPSNLTPGVEEAAGDYAHVRDCIQQYDDVDLPGDCVFGDPDGSRTAVVFGDSHAAHWLGAFDQAAADAHWKVVLRAKAACPVAEIGYVDDHFKRRYVECDKWRTAAVADVVRLRPDLVVISQADGTPGTKVTDEAYAAGTAKTMRALGAAGSRLLLLSDIPQPYQPVECVAAHLNSLDECVTTPTAGKRYWSKRRDATAAAARDIGAQVVDTNQWVCVGEKCPPVVGNMLVYMDSGGHLTNTFATWLAPVMRTLLDGSGGSPAGVDVTPALEKGAATTKVPSNLTPALDRAAQDVPATGNCHLGFLDIVQGPCEFADPAGTKTVVLFGDSHVNQWFGGIESAARKRHVRLINWTKSACPVAGMTVYAPALKRDYTECDVWRAATVTRILALHPDLVIAGQSDAVQSQADDQIWASATADTLRTFTAAGIDTVMLADNAYAPRDPVACVAANLADVEPCRFARSEGYYYARPARHAMVADAVRDAGLRIVETTDWMCTFELCPAIVGNMLVRRDLGHVTNTFATWLEPVLDSLLPGGGTTEPTSSTAPVESSGTPAQVPASRLEPTRSPSPSPTAGNAP